MEEIWYFEVNNWFSGRDYPDCEPFFTWMKDDFNLTLANENFVKENKICVCETPIDMSVSFLVTAPFSWVRENCPCLLDEKYSKFISEDKKPRYGFGHYLPYDEEHIGKIEVDASYFDDLGHQANISNIEDDVYDALQNVKLPKGKLYKFEILVPKDGDRIVTLVNGDDLHFDNEDSDE